ncbi:MAG: hypothetical protein M1819_000183 [Sarea resinae]|nr:MAG: hypothetical protein M1819_000183 [Sarea resinae]
MLVPSARVFVPRLTAQSLPRSVAATQKLWRFGRVERSLMTATQLPATNQASHSAGINPHQVRAYSEAAKTTKTRARAKPSTSAAKAKKPASKKVAPKKKTVKKAVKPKAKPKPKRKVLTPEQKEEAAKKKERVEIRELKKAALTAPKQLPETAFLVLSSELAKKEGKLNGKEAGERYKAFSPQELEHYNHIASNNKVANKEAYKTWVQSHTPDEIRQANSARTTLKRRLKKNFTKIKDDRQPSRPVMAYILFYKERLASGDLNNMSIQEKATLAAKEWKGLSESEKKNYLDRQELEMARYKKEFEATFPELAAAQAKKSNAKATA